MGNFVFWRVPGVLAILCMLATSYVCWVPVGEGDRVALLYSGAPRLAAAP